MIEWAKANPNKLIYGHTGSLESGGRCLETDLKSDRDYGQNGSLRRWWTGNRCDPRGAHRRNWIALGRNRPPYHSGKFGALAVLDSKREASLPNVPTAKEEGFAVVNLMWRGILAPKGTPRPIIEKLADAFKKMTENKSVLTMIKQFGDDIQYLGPDDFSKVWQEEYEAFGELGKIFKKK